MPGLFFKKPSGDKVVKTGPIFTLEVFNLFEKVWAQRRLGGEDLDFDTTVLEINKTNFRLFVI